MLVWTWYEHVEAARLIGTVPVQQILLLLDEVESHLHPEWQRTILPTLLEVGQELEDELSIQIVANSHEPMVLASLEPFFEL